MKTHSIDAEARLDDRLFTEAEPDLSAVASVEAHLAKSEALAKEEVVSATTGSGLNRSYQQLHA